MVSIRICIGTEPKTRLAEQVLIYSIKKRTPKTVDFISLIGQDWIVPKDLPQNTGFSLRRWLIPSKLNFSGRAIYLDADQLVLTDINELWSEPDASTSNSSAWLTYQQDCLKPKPWPQTSVMVIDCVKAEQQWQPELLWKLLRSGYNYQDFMHGLWMKPPPEKISNDWNGLDHFTNKTKLIHYTSEPNQPWYNPKHKLASIWQNEFINAIKDRAINKQLFLDSLGNWNKREDWRPTNGLHPFYSDYLKYFNV